MLRNLDRKQKHDADYFGCGFIKEKLKQICIHTNATLCEASGILVGSYTISRKKLFLASGK